MLQQLKLTLLHFDQSTNYSAAQKITVDLWHVSSCAHMLLHVLKGHAIVFGLQNEASNRM